MKRPRKMTTAGGRLKAAMTASLKSVEDVATALEVSEVAVRSWLRQTAPVMGISAAHATSLALFLNVRTVWLVRGRGAPERHNSDEVSRERLLAVFNRLDPEYQHLLLD